MGGVYGTGCPAERGSGAGSEGKDPDRFNQSRGCAAGYHPGEKSAPQKRPGIHPVHLVWRAVIRPLSYRPRYAVQPLAKQQSLEPCAGESFHQPGQER